MRLISSSDADGERPMLTFTAASRSFSVEPPFRNSSRSRVSRRCSSYDEREMSCSDALRAGDEKRLVELRPLPLTQFKFRAMSSMDLGPSPAGLGGGVAVVVVCGFREHFGMLVVNFLCNGRLEIAL